MKKLTTEKIQALKGGAIFGCDKWIRRYKRSVHEDYPEELQNALLDAFERCIHYKYES